MKNKIFYSWKDLECDIKAITFKNHFKKYDNIYGVPRGGLIMAVMLSYRTGKPLIFDRKLITDKTVVVDDISDSGDTLLKLIPKGENPRIITLFISPNTKKNPDIFIRVKRKEDWVVFPWETLDSSKYDGTINIKQKND